MDSNDSLHIINSTKLSEHKCLITSVVWKIAKLCSGALKLGGCSIISPTFRFSNLSWFLTFSYRKPLSVDSIFLTLVDNSLFPIPIPYFKLIISDSEKRILFEHAESCLTYVHSNQIEIEIGFIGDEILRKKNPLTISINFYVCDDCHSESKIGLKGIDQKEEDGSATLALSKCGSRGCKSACSDFEEFFNSRRFSDVTLKLADGEFQAHKLVLCARSKVFAAMFEHETKEKRTDTVNLVEMEAKTVRDMLRYLYCGKVCELSVEEALNLFVAADRYDLQELKSFCREVVLNGISTSNVCDVAEVAGIHDDELLIRKLKCFLSENGSEIIKTENWKSISAEKPSLCARMFEWAFSK